MPAGTPHSVRPAGDGTTRIVNVHQPALNHEAFFRDMHRLIEQGKIKRLPPGNPRPAISVGMLFDRSPDEIRSIKPPQAVSRRSCSSGARFGSATSASWVPAAGPAP